MPRGYERSVITTLRPYGRATLWWHAKSRTFRVKVDRAVKGQSERRLLLDAFAKVSGMVGRCAAGGCGLFFGKADPRQRFCGPKCADRECQRRARTRLRARRPEARVAFVESEARANAERQRRADWRAAQPYNGSRERVMDDVSGTLVAGSYVSRELAERAKPDALYFVLNGGRWPQHQTQDGPEDA